MYMYKMGSIFKFTVIFFLKFVFGMRFRPSKNGFLKKLDQVFEGVVRCTAVV